MKKLIRQTPGKMSPLFKVLWGMGNFGGSLVGGIVGAYQLFYYQNYLGMSASLYTLAILIYTIYNAVNDPILGFLSDNTKSKFGRRIPYFRASAPFVIISFILLFVIPIDLNPMIQFWWLLLTLVVYDLGFTMYYMMYTSLQAEITEYENERADMQMSYHSFAFLGSLIGMVLPGLIRPDFASATSVASFKGAIVIIGLVGLFFMLTTTFIVKERKELIVEQSSEKKSVFSAFKDTYQLLKVKPLRIAILINFIFRAQNALITALIYYIAFFVLHVDTTIFTIAVVLPTGIGLPIWIAIQRKIGAINVLKWSFIGGACALTLAVFFTGIPAIILFGLSGFCVAGMNITVNMLLFDCADYDELTNGKRREGSIFGANAFVMVFSFMITTIIPYVLQFTGFITAEQNGGVDTMIQPLSAVWGIKGMILLCAALLIVGLVLVLKYPLKGKKLEEMRSDVLALHDTKAKEQKA